MLRHIGISNYATFDRHILNLLPSLRVPSVVSFIQFNDIMRQRRQECDSLVEQAQEITREHHHDVSHFLHVRAVHLFVGRDLSARLRNLARLDERDVYVSQSSPTGQQRAGPSQREFPQMAVIHFSC